MKCLERAEELCESLVRVDALEWPVYNIPQAVIELTTASVLNRQLRGKTNEVGFVLELY